MSHNILNVHKTLPRAAITAVLVAGFFTPGQAAADVPAKSYTQETRGTLGVPVAKLLSDAQIAMKNGNIRLALINLKNAVDAVPRDGAVRARLGVLLLQGGDAAAAERELRQARKDGAPEMMVLPPLFQVMLTRNENQVLLDQFPDPGAASKSPAAPDTLKARALALQALKHNPEALEAMDRSLALRRDGGGLLTRARLSMMQGNLAEAKRFSDEAIAKSNDPDAMIFKVAMLLASNDNFAALEQANQLVAKYPDSIQGRFSRIEVYVNLNQDANAKAEVDSILAKYPTAYLGLYYKALLLARAGNAKAAWNVAQNLPAEMRDSQPRSAIMIAQMAVAAGNEETGASILNRILQKNPDLASARVRLAAIRLRQNSPAAALIALEPLKNSSDVAALEMLSNTYLQLNRKEDALNVLRKIDAQGKGSAEVKRNIALIEIQMGQTDQGIKDLTQIVSKNPTDAAFVGPLVSALTTARRFPEALAAADRLGSDPKKLADSLVLRGDVLALQGNNPGAQAAFDKAIASSPQNTSALYARARLLASQQKYADANRDLRAVLAVDPKNVPALMNLADIAARQGQDQNVRDILGQAIALAPSNVAPRIALTRYLIVRRDGKKALATVNDLLKIQPTNTDGIVLLGQVQFALGQKKEAAATYRRLAALLPTSSIPQVLLSNTLAALGDGPGAMRAIETAVKLSPSSPEVKAVQINLQFNQNNTDGAVTSARLFQTSHPGTNADILLADTLVRAKHSDQAAAVLNKSLADRPSSVVLLRSARIAMGSNNIKGATDQMATWLAKNPGDNAVRLEYATLLMQQADDAKATAQYQMVLKQEPKNVIALNNLGWLIQRSDPKQALALLTQAYQLSPNSADVMDTLGWVKIQQKDAAGGLDLLNRAHTANPKDGEITYHLVVALDANSKRDAARGLLKSLLASGVKFKDQPAAAQLAKSWQ